MSSEQKTSKGLHTPQLEKDSCGVGLLADLTNQPSNYIVDSALTMLENMEHRGACGCEENTGDGAGILTQIPHDFFFNEANKDGVLLPEKGNYGVAQMFFPKSEDDQEYCRKVLQKNLKQFDFKIIWTRRVPTDNSMIGETALQSEPEIWQFFLKTSSFNYKDLENRFYMLRNTVLKEIYWNREDLRDDFYIASLSSQTIVYKGLLRAIQLRDYFLDLQDINFKSAISIVHSRFSTNTFPKWKLAQPFRCIAHNGEINTIQGNINWWKSREQNMELVSKSHPNLTKVFPVCDPYISDSGNFDNVVDFLLRASRSIPHSIMMMIPEAWQNDDQMEDYKKEFYQYHDSVLEPWDGPASICFTDGTIVGATLDRNGLRPSRYLLTTDNLLVLGSEAGCLNIPQHKIKYKSRLAPGKMLVADLNEHRIISDEELKETICTRKPYGKWLKEHAKHIDDLTTTTEHNYDEETRRQRQIACGMTYEDEQLILQAMLDTKKEPIGSMGADIPLAVLSKQAQHIANYFKQQFAQVTNPPIDSIREKFFMTLSTAVGGGSKIIGISENESKVIRFDHPVLTTQQFHAFIENQLAEFEVHHISLLYPKEGSLKKAINNICDQAVQAITDGKTVLCINNYNTDKSLYQIPGLLAIGAIHHHLIEKGLRKEATLLANLGDVWETHHHALCLSYGADLIHPHLALETVTELAKKKGIEESEAVQKYLTACEKGILKIMSKLGVSTLASYKGAQTFEALGLSEEVIDTCFKGTISRIGGLSFTDIEKEQEQRHKLAFDYEIEDLPDIGVYQWKRRGEYHLFNPQTIHLLQHSTKSNDYPTYKRFTEEINKLSKNASQLRSFFKIKEGQSIPIEDVEPIESIMKRFASGAMSFGSISHEAHTTLAKAMNRIGGKSNSGEGGEDESRFKKLANGDWERSAIKQVASGRFGVSTNYLTNAEELQIKVAQGAKPGEGGQLPGHKVNEVIAKTRNSTPGVGLISPPPHHDIYSIEDLAQLIFELKNANRAARISVKLVSKAGVGVIASGVAKAHADHILISGFDGGTGASPLSSIRHAGVPWELGLAETHQTLVKNGLRDRVVLQTDGQIRTGRDMAIATMLGAEEWGIATAALVVEGCIMMRKCHLNTCPVGIATQDAELRKKFEGKVEHLVNYFHFLAQDLREIMASVGVKTVNELVGRTDLLAIEGTDQHWKTEKLKLDRILFIEENSRNTTLYNSREQDHGLDNILDKKLIYYSQSVRDAVEEEFSQTFPVISTDRSVGTMLSNEIAKKYGSNGLPEDSLKFKFKGSAGQSFGAWAIKGLFLKLEGEANDYFGKGLSGARLVVMPDAKASFDPSQNIIIGNVALYGAINGEAYINGMAGDRFCVRNSGVKAVVEGVGTSGCEYMTGGKVVVLGDFGRNFAAGMSGGIAYLYHPSQSQIDSINKEMVLLEEPNMEDFEELKAMLQSHTHYTGSKKAFGILNNWEEERKKFVKVIPEEYKKVIAQRKETKIYA